MALSEELRKKLSKKFETSALIDMRYKANDLSFKTDEKGNAVLLFIGKRRDDGSVKGERYARTLKKDKDGNVFKDHWELKRKAT